MTTKKELEAEVRRLNRYIAVSLKNAKGREIVEKLEAEIGGLIAEQDNLVSSIEHMLHRATVSFIGEKAILSVFETDLKSMTEMLRKAR